MQEQMGNVKQRHGNLMRKKLQQNQTAFDGLFSKLDMAEERHSELKSVSGESSKTKKQKNKD